MFSKSNQLRKNKKTNPKKLTREQKIEFIEFLKSKSGEVCQKCNERPAQDFAHADRGYTGVMTEELPYFAEAAIKSQTNQTTQKLNYLKKLTANLSQKKTFTTSLCNF